MQLPDPCSPNIPAAHPIPAVPPGMLSKQQLSDSPGSCHSHGSEDAKQTPEQTGLGRQIQLQTPGKMCRNPGTGLDPTDGRWSRVFRVKVLYFELFMFCSTHILYGFLAFPLPVAVPALVDCSRPDRWEFSCPGAACSSVLWVTSLLAGAPRLSCFPRSLLSAVGSTWTLFPAVSPTDAVLCLSRGLWVHLRWFGAAARAGHDNRNLDIPPGLSSAPCNNPGCFPHLPGLFHGKSFPICQGRHRKDFSPQLQTARWGLCSTDPRAANTNSHKHSRPGFHLLKFSLPPFA